MEPTGRLLRRTPFPCRARIFLAEDDEPMREMLASALRRDGCEVVEASNGVRLLSLLRNGPPADIVVTDLRMPGASGIDVLASLDAEKARRPVVILITAFGDSSTHAEAKKLGAAAVFDKPFDVDDLRMAILNLVPR